MSIIAPPIQDPAAEAHRLERTQYWNDIAIKTARRPGAGRYYHRRLAEVYRYIVSPGLRVLELGCGRGELLAALQPAHGVGVDLSPEMISQARTRHPQLRFIHADALDFSPGETFDIIILSDLINDLWDVQRMFEKLRSFCTPRTRIILNFYSRLWEWPLAAAFKLGLAYPMQRQNWMTREDVANLLYLAGFEVTREWHEVLWPIRTPGADALFNKFLVKLWPMSELALTNVMIARPAPGATAEATGAPPEVSVIIAARNEAGNIQNIFERVPEMGAGTELIFVEGGSTDQTYEAIEQAIALHPRRNARVFRQPGIGKADAIRKGFAEARGEILIILDADLTVPPEDLPRFYEALAGGRGEFVNGVRLVYPMQKQAMRMLNLIGNKFFGLAFSWMLGQSIKDTLCGTKAIRRDDYERIAANRAYFGDFDPFGDFDLLFGAAKLNLKIVDLPVRYRERTYGTTNIHRWRHGWMLMRMVGFAARKMKFV